MRQLASLAAENGCSFEVSEGGNHTKVRLAGILIPIPRHREINERLALAILTNAKKIAENGP
jgi:mRNA interferase HicA